MSFQVISTQFLISLQATRYCAFLFFVTSNFDRGFLNHGLVPSTRSSTQN